MTARRVRPSLVVLAALTMLVAGVAYSVSNGEVKVPVADVFAIIGHRWLHLPIEEPTDPRFGTVVWSLRFPRILLGALVGAGLAVAGVAAQALVRNPLAEPFVLGISSGATVGTLTVVSFSLGSGGLYWRSAAAVFGALGALLLVLLFARAGAAVSPIRLILAGIAIGHLLAAASSYLAIRTTGVNLYYWLTGNLGTNNMHDLWLPAIVLSLALLALLFDGSRMNALLIGDETASSLGVNVFALRLRLIVISAVLVGVMVAQSGIIGFVGLVVPHLARLIVGTDHRHVIPVAASMGAAFLVFCDIVSREVLEPSLIPVGIVAGGIGAPLFLLFIWRGIATKGA